MCLCQHAFVSSHGLPIEFVRDTLYVQDTLCVTRAKQSNAPARPTRQVLHHEVVGLGVLIHIKQAHGMGVALGLNM